MILDMSMLNFELLSKVFGNSDILGGGGGESPMCSYIIAQDPEIFIYKRNLLGCIMLRCRAIQ